MQTLVVGASGATGKHLVEQLLLAGHKVKIVVRSPEKLPDSWRNNDQITIIHASVLEISEAQMAAYLKDCDAVGSCLGHNLTFKGIYGQPRQLVTDTIRLVSNAIEKNQPTTPVRLVLMNTAGNSNRDIQEPISFGEKLILGLLRLLLPPHVDNEKASDFLRLHIGQKHPYLKWTIVRPDSLINEAVVTPYDLHPSPTRSALFNPGKTSRINVGHFMAQLMENDELWEQWVGQMPIIYNQEEK